MAKGAVGSAEIVVVLPIAQRRSSMLERRELGEVQTLVAKATVERLDQPVLDGLARADEVELHAAFPRPLVEGPGSELAAVVNAE
jgi:hypothetical protein